MNKIHSALDYTNNQLSQRIAKIESGVKMYEDRKQTMLTSIVFPILIVIITVLLTKGCETVETIYNNNIPQQAPLHKEVIHHDVTLFNRSEHNQFEIYNAINNAVNDMTV